MDFATLPLPTVQSKQLKYYKQLHLNQRLHLKKELESKQVPALHATARNKIMYQQELNNLTNDRDRIHNILGKGPLAYQTAAQIEKRREELKKLISF